MSKSSTDPRLPWLIWMERVLKDPGASARLAWVCAALIVAYAYLLTQAGQNNFGFPAGRDAREVQRERQRQERLVIYANSLGLPAPEANFQLPQSPSMDLEVWLAQVLEQAPDHARFDHANVDPLARAAVAEALRLTFDFKDLDLRELVRDRGQLSFWDQLKTWEEECRNPSWSVAALCEHATQKNLMWLSELSLWSLRHVLALRLVAEVVDQSPPEKIRRAREWVARLKSQDMIIEDRNDLKDLSNEPPAPWSLSWTRLELREASLRLEWKLGLADLEVVGQLGSSRGSVDDDSELSDRQAATFLDWSQRRRSEIQAEKMTWRLMSGEIAADSQVVESEFLVWAGCGSVTAAKLARLKSRYLVWIHGRDDVADCDAKATRRLAQSAEAEKAAELELRQVVLPQARVRLAWSADEEMRFQVKELARLNPRLKMTVLNLEALRLATQQGLLSPMQRRQLDLPALTLAELQDLHPLLRPQSVSEMSHGLLAVKSPLPLVVVLSQISAI